jgi:hypothetical protein
MTFENRMICLELAKIKGEPLFLGTDGSAFHDPLINSDYVDVVNSVNIQVNNGVSYSGGISEITKDMTSANTPSPFVISANAYSTYSQGGEPFKAFDGSADSGWYYDGATGWLRIDCGSLKNINRYTLSSRKTFSSEPYTGFPLSYNLEGSNDNVNWDVIDTQSGLVWVCGETKTFDIPDCSYRYFKINVTQAAYNRIIICNFGLFHVPVADMTLISNGIQCVSQPDTIHICGYIDNSVEAFASRDEENWTQGVFNILYETQEHKAFHAVIDVSGQSPGSVIKYKLVGNFNLNAIAMWAE